MIRVDNSPRDYAWGSLTDIATLRGLTPSGKPEAELWLGTHPGSPTQIVEPESAGGARTIAEYLSQTDQQPLPHLLKILAAAHPLSIQAHPSPEQAREGFARENAVGIPLDAPHRNYRDDAHKPELIFALSDTFEALCGFRPLEDTLTNLELLAQANTQACHSTSAIVEFTEQLVAHGENAIRWALEWALSGDNAVALVAEVAVAGRVLKDDLLIELSTDYPGDPGVIVALLLNRVTLTRGQALYLPAGNMHAYIRGLGIELMAASDNVLRGGLTTKHVDVPELLSVVSDAVVPVPLLEAQPVAPGIDLFVPDVPDFRLAHVVVTKENSETSQLSLSRNVIVTCTAGKVTVTGAHSSLELSQGQNAFISAEEAELSFSGIGELFLAL
ncbi:mannose-6-phosphate isomerase, class I [Aurantimicrobium minutum]|uniref:mannose-6-phosphate isomerase, class I n=1 Tax=Aurantimicrobium minutum TaxID=708131 RepID=UPI0024744645|nr:mannose-6-phosphate isomerase, class I [Aurantimicrobium minutum]